jgi:hypothetical protein
VNCPACRGALIVVERDGIEVDWCPLCRGLWFDAGELDLLAERRGRSLPTDDANATPRAPRAASRRCPRCGKKMVTALLGGGVVDSGKAGGGEAGGEARGGEAGRAQGAVVIDRCPAHGIWFDAGELAEALRPAPAHDETGDAMVLRFLGETFGAGLPRRGDSGRRDG